MATIMKIKGILKVTIFSVFMTMMVSSCTSKPHKALAESIDSILAEEIENPDRTESYSTSYKQWIANLYQDCVMAKALVSDVEGNSVAIMSFRTKDFCFFPKNYMSQGTEIAVDCAKKAAIGNYLDGNMSKLGQLLIQEELFMNIPKAERDGKFSADTAYIHYGMKQVVDKILYICDKGENELKGKR